MQISMFPQMLTVQATPPKRKSRTYGKQYGKAVRRVLPDYNFAPTPGPSKSQTPEKEIAQSSKSTTTLPSQLNSIEQRLRSSTPSSASPAANTVDIFDDPVSDDEGEATIAAKSIFQPRLNVYAGKGSKGASIARPAGHAKLDNSELRSGSNTLSTSTPLPTPSRKVDIFDVPSSDDEKDNAIKPVAKPKSRTHQPKNVTKPLRAPAGISSKLNGLQLRSRSSTPLSASPLPPPLPPPSGSSRKLDLFDVPSSDAETPLITAKLNLRPKPKVTTSKVPKRPSPKQHPDGEPGSDGYLLSRKRVKLSLVRPVTKVSSAKPPPSNTLPNTMGGMSPKPSNTGVGQRSSIAARPKSKAQSASRSHTSRKPNPALAKFAQHPTLYPKVSDVDMMEVDGTPKPKQASPNGLQMWNGLLDTAEEPGTTLHGTQTRSKVLYTSHADVSRVSQPTPIARSKLPRRRLIDSLVEQAIEDDELDEHISDRDDFQPVQDAPSSDESSRSESLAPEPAIQQTSSQSSQAPVLGPKVTYSRQRSFLAEEDLMQQLALDMPMQPTPGQVPKPRRGAAPTLPQLPSFHEEAEEEAEGAGAAILSVHELRQAGANSRLLDEIEDLLDRIGSPVGGQTSLRRSGLLEMATQLKDKNFARQFRSTHVEQRLFVHLGQETDPIAGYLLVSMLMTVLADGSVPPFIVQLRRQGIARLLIRLLEVQSSIVMVVKDRKSNASKIAQKLVIDYHTYLMKLPLWEDLEPDTLSPRTVALKCLEVMVRQTREAGSAADIFSKELTTNLFTILKDSTIEASWDLPKSKQAIDFYLALSALESHSITARTVQDEKIWITDYLPIISNTLEIGLPRPAESFGILQVLLLRLTLNVTNNNSKASDVFAKSQLMAIMGQAVLVKFKQISRFMIEEELTVALEHLILMLGVMINFGEWSSAARQSLDGLHGTHSDPLDGMIQTFTDNRERVSEASSVEESHKNVAFGYLSVVLGYLSLLPRIAERVAHQQPGKTIRPLINSIEEFISHHKAADLITADEEGYNPQSGMTERLESLVRKLRC